MLAEIDTERVYKFAKLPVPDIFMFELLRSNHFTTVVTLSIMTQICYLTKYSVMELPSTMYPYLNHIPPLTAPFWAFLVTKVQSLHKNGRVGRTKILSVTWKTDIQILHNKETFKLHFSHSVRGYQLTRTFKIEGNIIQVANHSGFNLKPRLLSEDVTPQYLFKG